MTHAARVTDAAHLRRLHRSILRASFPREELCTEEELVDAAASGQARVWASRREGTDVGVAVVEEYGVRGLAFLAWLALAPGHRAAGGGTELLTAVLAEEAAGGVRYLIGEIEDPALPPDERYGDPAGRARFYSRLGARALVLPHEQPPMAPGLPPVPLLLMVLPTREDGTQPLVAPDVLQFLTRYGHLPPDGRRARTLATLLAGGVPWGDLTSATFDATRALA